MFNKNFYPTPLIGCEALFKGISPRDLARKTILEPQAGKGDILEYIQDRQSPYIKSTLLCMEIEPELVAILQDKDFKVIGNDFLSDPVHYNIDFIFMNPPFDQGAKHLLRAWDIIKNGTIRCLLNAETYNNAHTKERSLLADIINQNGSVTHLGNIFKNAERTTNVDVIIVELIKKTQSKFDFNSDFETESFAMPNDLGNTSELIIHDMLSNREARYQASINLYNEMILAKKKFEACIKPLVSDYKIREYHKADSFNDFIGQFNGDAWDQLLTESKFANLLTKRVREDFIYKQFPKQKNIAFTKPNMVQLLSILMNNQGLIVDRCILDVFDLLTRYHKENRVHIEGWKTNEAYKVGMKFILPRVMKEYDSIFGTFSLDYGNDHVLDDIDIVMCFLTGQKLSSIDTCRKVLNDEFQKHKKGEPFSKSPESTFFQLKFFKKGTIHFKFKSEQLWQWFNCKASELRGYPLPEAKEVYSKTLVVL